MINTITANNNNDSTFDEYNFELTTKLDELKQYEQYDF